MNLTLHRSLWDKIQQFAFDDSNVTITFSKKLAIQQHWTSEYTQRVIEEYRKFIFLCCISPKGASPSKAIDEAWHLHLTYTQSYWNEFCKDTLGKEIHHYPSTGGEKEDQKHTGWYEDTLKLYESVFGSAPPTDIWPKANEQYGISNGQNYRLDKKMAARLIVLLLLPFGINYIFTNEASPFSIKGTQFLLFYLFLVAAALFAHYLLRKNKLVFMKKRVGDWLPRDVSIYQLTYKAYGTERAVQTGLVDLYRRNLISVNSEGKIVAHRKKYEEPVKEDNPMIHHFLNKADNSIIEYDTISNEWFNRSAFEHPALEQLFSLSDEKESFFKKYGVVLMAFFIGLARVMQGISNDRPVMLLILEIAVLAGVTLFIDHKFSSGSLLRDKVKSLMQENAGNKTIHADDVVYDYAQNGQSVLDWLPAGLMLASIFAVFPAITVAESSGFNNNSITDRDWGSDNSSGSSCSGGSSCSSGGGCGGCGSGGGD